MIFVLDKIRFAFDISYQYHCSRYILISGHSIADTDCTVQPVIRLHMLVGEIVLPGVWLFAFCSDWNDSVLKSAQPTMPMPKEHLTAKYVLVVLEHRLSCSTSSLVYLVHVLPNAVDSKLFWP